ncbi:unnamed protein product [Pleuronectes platessa]|uniref:Uncharacterized protein n=1 Tax=Pleuronectes platessa TaxID=8262 RepID=A0A9N7V7L6_PLEPL|nr:unnamed protein product [Pleuronectes platessa]
MPSSPAAITVHGQQPSRPRSTIQTRRHSSPQSPSTAAHQDPSRATTAVHTGSNTATPVRDPQTAIHGAATEALDLRVIKQRDSGDRDGEEEGEAGKRSSDTCCGILDKL